MNNRRLLRRLSVALAAIAVAVFLFGIRAPAQQVGTLYLGAPVFGSPNARTEPILIAGPTSTAALLAREGEWYRISVEDAQGRTRIGYVEATYVTVSQFQRTVPDGVVPPLPRVEDLPRAAPTDTRGSAPRRRVRNVKVRGYVTAFRSPDDFDIEDYRITRDDAVSLDVENASPELRFQLSDIRVGVELEIRGSLNEDSGQLKAKSIKVDLEQFKSIRQTALVSQMPVGIQLRDGSWAGELRADGQVIRVTRGTSVTFKATKGEKKLAELGEKGGAQKALDAAEPLQLLDQVQVGMTMTYEGKRDLETGKVLAEKIEFSTNDLDDVKKKIKVR